MKKLISNAPTDPDQNPSTLITNKKYLLEKYPGKGGWTYAAIPEIKQNPKNPFGWVRVKGQIDNFKISDYKLMPMGDGRLFLPVRADIRKKINKTAGDTVHIMLFLDEDPVHLPDEFRDALLESPKAFRFFGTLSENKKSNWIKWLVAAKSDASKVMRMAQAIELLGKKKSDPSAKPE
jgi:hypothetical protein